MQCVDQRSLATTLHLVEEYTVRSDLGSQSQYLTPAGSRADAYPGHKLF